MVVDFGTYCTGPVWDKNLTWNTYEPKISGCFQDTILLWIPCIFIWGWSLTQSCQFKGSPNVWTIISILKYATNLVLLAVKISALVLHVPLSYPLIIECVTLLFCLVISLFLRHKGVQATAGFPIFWTLMALKYGVSIYMSVSTDWRIVNVSLDIVSCALALLLICLSSFAEKNPAVLKNCSLEDTSFYNRLLFFWFMKIIKMGYKGELSKSVLFPLCSSLRSSQASKTIISAFFKKSEHSTPLPDDSTAIQIKQPKSSLFFALIRTAWVQLFTGIALELFASVLLLFSVQLLNIILDFLKKPEILWHGFFYAIAFYITTVAIAFIYTHGQYYCLLAAVKVKSSLISAIYRKVFRLSNGARKDYTAGEIQNHMSVDTEEIFYVIELLNEIFNIPFLTIVSLYLLWKQLGPASLTGVTIFVALIPLTYFVSQKMDKLYEKQLAKKDKRLKIMSEILNGIKVLKLYAWENPFMRQVLGVRKEEIAYLRKAFNLDGVFVLVWRLSPQIISIITFSIYLHINSDHQLTPTKAFVSFSLFNILRYPMGALPNLLSHLVRSRVSIRRIQKFLDSEEIDFSCVGSSPLPGQSVTIANASLAWTSTDEAPVLSNINLSVPEGSLVAIVGPIGSGKTSLLSALLGELHKMEGSLNVKGPIAYVPQQAWIQNATFQENITFTQTYKPNFYNKVIEACALLPDLEVIPGGDSAEIGEKGINLSGGQKQRVSLARAIYQNLQLYVLDDPLSAVDAHVAAHLFSHVIGSKGLLRNKTRLLVTHNLSVLSETDWVVVMEDGKIVEQGPYNELTNREGPLSLLINTHLRTSNTDSSSDIKKTELKRLESIAKSEDSCNAVTTTDVGKLTDEEKMEEGEVTWRVYVSYLKEVGYRTCFLIVLLSIMTNCLEVGIGLWVSLWTHDDPSDKKQLLMRNLVYVGLFLIQAIVLLAEYFTVVIGSIRAAIKYHEKLLNSLMHAPLKFFDTTPMGRIINRFSRDIDAIDTNIQFNFEFWMSQLIYDVAIVLTICFTSAMILVVLVPVCIIYYFILRIYIHTSRQLKRIESTTRSPVYDNFSESVSGATSIRAFKELDHFIERSNTRVDTNLNAYYHCMVASRWLTIYLSIIGGFIVLACALFSILNKSTLSAGFIGLVLSYSMEITDCLNWLVSLSSDLESSFVSVERIREYSNLEPEKPWEIDSTQPDSEWPKTGEIVLKDYTTAYRPDLESVLKDINIEIKPREKVGIVGRTGSGKSSFVLSLFRILEAQHGSIEIDKVDISTLGLHCLRSRLSIIPQDPVIFANTLRVNLDPWDQHSDDKIWTALEQAHLKQFVSTLPEGLSYEITEGGANLSNGQRQLLCLTRALLRQTQVLVLDEATASVDLDTDKLVQETIRQCFSSCTIITIAHRLHTIMDSDKILVLSNGEIVEEGSPTQLLAIPNSTFLKLAQEAGLA